MILPREKKRIVIQQTKQEVKSDDIEVKDIREFFSNPEIEKKHKTKKISQLNKNKDLGRRSVTCIDPECLKRASFGYERGVLIHCMRHKWEDERNQTNSYCKCGKTARYCLIDGRPTLCEPCARKEGFETKLQKHRSTTASVTKEELEEHKRVRETKKEAKCATQIGDDSEIWVESLLAKNFTDFKVERIGHLSNAKFDIIAIDPAGVKRGIQVKTLTKVKTRPDAFYFTNDSYPSHTLIVAVNRDRDRFVAMFSDEIKAKNAEFHFLRGRSKYEVFMFRSEKELISRIREMLPKTVDSSEVILRSDNCQMEFEMIERLRENCLLRSFEFERSKSNVGFDVTVNGFYIECKCTSYMSHSTFMAQMNKRNGKLKGKVIQRPYSVEDNIDFFIFQIVPEGNPGKYNKDFLIIPVKDLIEHGTVSTQTQNGKRSVCIPPPDHKPHNGKSHTLSKFWNRWDLLLRKS